MTALVLVADLDHVLLNVLLLFVQSSVIGLVGTFLCFGFVHGRFERRLKRERVDRGWRRWRVVRVVVVGPESRL